MTTDLHALREVFSLIASPITGQTRDFYAPTTNYGVAIDAMQAIQDVLFHEGICKASDFKVVIHKHAKSTLYSVKSPDGKFSVSSKSPFEVQRQLNDAFKPKDEKARNRRERVIYNSNGGSLDANRNLTRIKPELKYSTLKSDESYTVELVIKHNNGTAPYDIKKAREFIEKNHTWARTVQVNDSSKELQIGG